MSTASGGWPRLCASTLDLIEAVVDLRQQPDDLRRQRDRLLVLSAEPQETNHGVMARCSDLPGDLAQTSRGVIGTAR